MQVPVTVRVNPCMLWLGALPSVAIPAEIRGEAKRLISNVNQAYSVRIAMLRALQRRRGGLFQLQISMEPSIQDGKYYVSPASG